MADPKPTAGKPAPEGMSAPAPRITAMQAQYICQNPHETTTSTQGVVNGEPMLVTVPVFEVELTALDRTNGGIKLRYMGADVAGAKDLFKNDQPVTATFAPGPPLPADYVTP